MANTPAWFKKEDYLASKLAQLIESGETEYETPEQVEEAIEAEGFTAFEHFEKFGGEEKTSPNAYFDVAYYLQAKADELNANADEPRDDWTAEEVYDAIIAEGLTPWSHFQAWGWKEGVNPSADFDLNAYFEDKLQQLIDNGETEYENVDDVIAAFEVNDIDPITHYYAWGAGEGLEPKPADGEGALVAALEALAAAEAEAAAVLAAAAEAVNAAEDDPLEGDDLEEFIAEFDADDLEQAIEDAEDAVDVAESALEDAEGDLSVARGEKFEDEGQDLLDAVAAATATNDAFDKNGSAVEYNINLGVAGDSRMTDANVASALQAAQKAVNADKAQYLADGSRADADQAADVDVETFTAKALQTNAIVTAATLESDITSKGDNVALLTSLRASIAGLVDGGVPLNTEVEGADELDGSAGDTLGDILDAINELLNADPIVEGDVDAFVVSFVDGTDPVLEDLDTGNAALDEAFNGAVAVVTNRAELTEAAADAADAFEATVTGAILVEAQEISDAREAAIQAVTDAEQDLADANELLVQLEGFQSGYEDALEGVEAAQQYFVDNDLMLPVNAEGSVTATEGNDIFLYVEEDAIIAGFNLEGEDILFVGKGFDWVVLDAADDFEGGRFGDAAAFEIFAQQDGGNVVLYIENEAFAGNELNLDDVTIITLTGVNVEDLALSTSGIIA